MAVVASKALYESMHAEAAKAYARFLMAVEGAQGNPPSRRDLMKAQAEAALTVHPETDPGFKA